MSAGMNWVTEPSLVSAVSNAGGLGLFAIARCTPKEVRDGIMAIRSLTDRPFGINQALTYPSAKPNIEVALEEKVPVINYSLGKPWFIEEVHHYGGKILGTVATVRHAIRAQETGVDALVVTGHEAAGHGHYATSMVLVPLVSDVVRVPIIAAGGFFDGRGLAAALMLGADGISMGTRFMLTEESMVHNNFKEACLKATEQDTLYSDMFDGMNARVLNTRAAVNKLRGRLPIVGAIIGALEVKKMLGLSNVEFIRSSIRMSRSEDRMPLAVQARMAEHQARIKAAVQEGNLSEGILSAGQIVGGIRDIPTCQELIDRIVLEASELRKRANEKVGEFS